MKSSNTANNMERLRNIECFVLDMDGTFNLGMQLIPGAMDFYSAAAASGRRVMFLTNNSSRDGGHYVQKLHSMGCPAKLEDVYTSGMATCQYLLREHAGKKVYLLGNEHLKAEFERYGVPLDDVEPDMVVVGFDTTLDYEKMCVVCDLVREGLPYIATHPDYNCPTETGFIPDIGAIMAFIEASTGRKADMIIGKPHTEIVNGLMEMTRPPKDKIAICGDRLYTDIATGVNFGILSICVLTGETSPEDIKKSEIKPDLVFAGLGEIAGYL